MKYDLSTIKWGYVDFKLLGKAILSINWKQGIKNK